MSDTPELKRAPEGELLAGSPYDLTATTPVRRQVFAGESVTFHGEDGDVELAVLRFDSTGAYLDAGSGEFRASEGVLVGQWSR